MLLTVALALVCGAAYSEGETRYKPVFRQGNGYTPYPTYTNWWDNVNEYSGSSNGQYLPNPGVKEIEFLEMNDFTPRTLQNSQAAKEYSEEDGKQTPYLNQLTNTPEPYPSEPASHSEYAYGVGRYPNKQNTNSPILQDTKIPKYENAPETQTLNVQGSYFSNGPYPPQQAMSVSYDPKPRHGQWQAPPFYASLQYFDEAFNMIQSRMQNHNSSENYDNQVRYTTIIGVLGGMIRFMTQSPWQYYDQEYKSKVPGLIKYSQVASYEIKSRVTCVYRWADRSINKLRKILNNGRISNLCRVSKVPCDVLILAIVESANNNELKREARTLLALGKSARLFLDEYANMIDRQAIVNNWPSNLELFLLNTKDYFKPLIRASTEALKSMPSPIYCPGQFSSKN